MPGLLKDMFSLGYYAATRVFPPYRRDKEIVLLYHSIGGLCPGGDEYKLNLRSSTFEEQMVFLSSCRQGGAYVTFDDGYEDFFNIALPLLCKYNIKTVLFVTTGFINGLVPAASFLNKNYNVRPLTWPQIKQAADAGVEIGSHTLSHRNLSLLDKKSAYLEIFDSKKIIEDKIGRKVRYFAYPFGSRGSFNDRIKEMVAQAGYEKAYSNIMGFNGPDSDPYELRRLRIYADDNMFRFGLKIKGAYNWVDDLTGLQRIKRQVGFR